MKDTETIAILQKMLKQYPYTKSEQKTILNAIGILSWTTLAEGMIQHIRARQEEKRRTNGD